jgi:hypothetical protein
MTTDEMYHFSGIETCTREKEKKQIEKASSTALYVIQKYFA